MNTKMIAGAALAAMVVGCTNTGEKNVEMKPGDVRHGFVLKGCTELPELGGRLWRMEYAKNGAELVWLERADENKTFGFAFRTLP